MKWSYLIVVLFIIVAGTYYFFRGDTISPNENTLSQYIEAGVIKIDSVEFSYQRDVGFFQITALVRGNVPDSCTLVGTYTERWEGSTFFVNVLAKRPERAVCAEVITPFEETIVLYPVRSRGGLVFPSAPSSSGEYTINMNGHQDTFTLHEDDFIE